MGLIVKDFVAKLTLPKIEDRIKFNEITSDELELFIENFLTETESERISYLIKIIEEVDDNELLEGNYKKFFDNTDVRALLKKCL